MSNTNPFFLVWNPNRDAPRHRHGSYAAAKIEAERLARISPGESFYILEAVSMTRRVDVETIKLERAEENPDQLDEQIPF